VDFQFLKERLLSLVSLPTSLSRWAWRKFSLALPFPFSKTERQGMSKLISSCTLPPSLPSFRSFSKGNRFFYILCTDTYCSTASCDGRNVLSWWISQVSSEFSRDMPSSVFSGGVISANFPSSDSSHLQ